MEGRTCGCRFVNLPEARFCARCGNRLTGNVRAEKTEPVVTSAKQGNRLEPPNRQTAEGVAAGAARNRNRWARLTGTRDLLYLYAIAVLIIVTALFKTTTNSSAAVDALLSRCLACGLIALPTLIIPSRWRRMTLAAIALGLISEGSARLLWREYERNWAPPAVAQSTEKAGGLATYHRDGISFQHDPLWRVKHVDDTGLFKIEVEDPDSLLTIIGSDQISASDLVNAVTDGITEKMKEASIPVVYEPASRFILGGHRQGKRARMKVFTADQIHEVYWIQRGARAMCLLIRFPADNADAGRRIAALLSTLTLE